MSSQYPHPIIAKEGWWFIAVLIVLFMGSLWMKWIGLSVLLGVILIFVIQFFRDPSRVVPNDDGAIISPADGRIVAVERVLDPYSQEPRVKISVFMNVFNVHSNRIPVDGEVQKVSYHPGQFLNAALDKASDANERNAIVIQTKSGRTVTCIQVAGLVARRILCYVGAGSRVFRGMRYGFIRFGSRVDVYLPLDVQVNVALGQKVRATETVLARWGSEVS